MTKSMPNVQDFLDAYATHGRKPCFRKFGAVDDKGSISAEAECCPLTALCIGQPSLPGHKMHPSDQVCRIAQTMYPKFDAGDFFFAFDGAGVRGPSGELALKVREALVQAGYEITNPPVPDATTEE